MREEATHVTVCLGSVYLCYSAFFVTIEIPVLNIFVKYAIACVYLMLSYYVAVNVLRNIRILKVNIRHSGQIPGFDETLNLKL